MRAFDRFAALAVFTMLPLAACSDAGTGPDLNDDGNAPAPEFQVTLAADDGGASSSLGVSAKMAAASAGIPLDAIVGIHVTIDRVEVHRNASGEGGTGGWQTFQAVNPELNLVDLPAEGVELVEGTLEQGTYDQLRLILTGQPTIELSQDVVVNNRTIAAGVHDLDIPSSQNSGIKIDGAFSVSDDGQALRILFDAAAAVSNIRPTGNGAIKMPPKMKVQDKDGDDVGETADEEDDAEDGGDSDDGGDTDDGQDDGDTDDGDTAASNADFGVVLGEVDSPPTSGFLGSAQLQAAGSGIPSSALDAINVTVARVDVHGPGGGWQTVGTPNATVNLLDIPGSGVTLVDTELLTGEYNQLRLILTGQATLELNSEIELSKGNGKGKGKGGSQTLGPGTVDLDIPSANQSGIKIKGGFQVGDGGELLLLLFDDAETIDRLKVTGNGGVRMSPVFHLTDSDGDIIGETEDEGDEDGEDDADDEDGEDDADDEDDGDDAGVEFQGSVTDADAAAGSFTLEDGRTYVLAEGVSPDAEGDLLTLEEVEQALTDGLAVRAEGEGEVADDGTVAVAAVKFETDGDDAEDDGGSDDGASASDSDDGPGNGNGNGGDNGNKGGNGKGKGNGG